MRSTLVPFVLLSAVACTSFEREVTPTDSFHRMGVATDAALGSPARATTATEAPSATPFAPARADDGIGKPYTMVHLGWFDPMGDIDGLDNGFWGDVTVGRKVLGILAIEGSAGYLEAGVPLGDEKLWGIPLFLNARATLPIPIVEPYVGAGAGGLYTEYPGNSDFVFAWNAMAGVGVGIGQLQVGAEYRYLKSDDTDQNFAIEGQSVSLFASLPF